jgi:hypothetical protein
LFSHSLNKYSRNDVHVVDDREKEVCSWVWTPKGLMSFSEKEMCWGLVSSFFCNLLVLL